MAEHSMWADPIFWSWLILACAIVAVYVHGAKTRTVVDGTFLQVNELMQVAQKVLAERGATADYFSGQADISIHHSYELTRLRESVLELAADAERLARLQYITTIASFPGETAAEVIARIFHEAEHEPGGWPSKLALSSRVFERHNELPDELPDEIKANHRRDWVCPFCDTRMTDNWSGWCTTCRRRTFGVVQARPETYPPPDHEATSPDTFNEEFSCFACQKVFRLTQHPLMAVCPHCGARQTDVALDFERGKLS